jgi:hypothetical protein
MMVNAPKPISAEPAARPSRPSVTLTALVVAQMMSPAQITQSAVGISNAEALGAGDRDRLGDAGGRDEPPRDAEAHEHRDVVLLLPEDAPVVPLLDLDVVVEEPHERHRQHADPHDQRLVGEREPGSRVRDDPPDERGTTMASRPSWGCPA